ncbi:MAG: hypothetical protein D6812_02410, partial [Deltaproteobacteria bacterium]
MNPLICFYCSGEHPGSACCLEGFSSIEAPLGGGRSSVDEVVDHLGHLPVERLDEFFVLEEELSRLDRCNDPQEAERIMRVTSEFIQVIPWTHVESY